jgi:hypothetical protein
MGEHHPRMTAKDRIGRRIYPENVCLVLTILLDVSGILFYNRGGLTVLLFAGAVIFGILGGIIEIARDVIRQNREFEDFLKERYKEDDEDTTEGSGTDRMVSETGVQRRGE